MIENKQKGITLISLVVTIIVLLILAVISVNSIMGENGIIARAKESRILTILADILFNLDSNIIDINTDNILNDRKMVSTEMMDELIGRELVEGKDDYDNFWNFQESLQYKVKGTNIENFFISYNGDVWLDNYKRGKVQLTTNMETIYTPNAQTKITVIDGTVDEFTPNKEYYLHAIKEREDFICWVNQYGEIVSHFADTVVNIEHRKEAEYTAIYSYKLRYDIPSFYSKILVGMDSNVSKNGENIDFDLDITCLSGTCLTQEYRNNRYEYPFAWGVGIAGVLFYTSPNYEDLINVAEADKDEDFFDSDLRVLVRYNDLYRDYFEDGVRDNYFEEFPKLENGFPEVADLLGWSEPKNGYYIPVLEYENLSALSQRYHIYSPVSIKNSYPEKDINRIYYRCKINLVLTVWYMEGDDSIGLYVYDDKDVDSEYQTANYWEPTIKYIDL